LQQGDDEIAGIPDTDECAENPFSCCYKPENLYRLAQELDLQSGIDLWEPSEYRARTVRAIIILMGKRIVEFLDWIDERMYASE